MKNAIIGLLLSFMFSCTNDREVETLREVLGNWELVEMSGSIPNSVTTGADMEWQETYQLNIDATFLKTREREGVITTASGKFTVVTYLGAESLELVFDDESDIIGSCVGNRREYLRLDASGILIGSWEACDGPGLVYRKDN